MGTIASDADLRSVPKIELHVRMRQIAEARLVVAAHGRRRNLARTTLAIGDWMAGEGCDSARRHADCRWDR